jgi:hypothetical protein
VHTLPALLPTHSTSGWKHRVCAEQAALSPIPTSDSCPQASLQFGVTEVGPLGAPLAGARGSLLSRHSSCCCADWQQQPQLVLAAGELHVAATQMLNHQLQGPALRYVLKVCVCVCEGGRGDRGTGHGQAITAVLAVGVVPEGKGCAVLRQSEEHV